jgi:hypothetical protein
MTAIHMIKVNEKAVLRIVGIKGNAVSEAKFLEGHGWKVVTKETYDLKKKEIHQLGRKSA